MPSKKKPQATKLKVELKNLQPKKNPKGGVGISEACLKANLTQAYCSGVT
jgi:hypothetical protein